jgi:mRNA interferase HigB
MFVTRADRLQAFWEKHADAEAALTAWLQIVEAATWRTAVDLRATYGRADPAVPVASGQRVAVFNIKGNKYRLIAAVDYALGAVNVLRVLTHAEYSKEKWKALL